MIPDTSGQDTLIATAPTQSRQPKRLVWLLAAVVGAALIVWLASSWLGSSRSVDVARIRMPPARSAWCTTASSKTTWSCAKN